MDALSIQPASVKVRDALKRLAHDGWNVARHDKMRLMEYIVFVEKGRRSYSVFAPDLPGCVAAGRTRAQALRLMRTAIRWHLDALRKNGEAVPEPTTDIARVRVA